MFFLFLFLFLFLEETTYEKHVQVWANKNEILKIQQRLVMSKCNTFDKKRYRSNVRRYLASIATSPRDSKQSWHHSIKNHTNELTIQLHLRIPSMCSTWFKLICATKFLDFCASAIYFESQVEEGSYRRAIIFSELKLFMSRDSSNHGCSIFQNILVWGVLYPMERRFWWIRELLWYYVAWKCVRSLASTSLTRLHTLFTLESTGVIKPNMTRPLAHMKDYTPFNNLEST